MNVTVFCSCSQNVSPFFFAVSEELGSLLAAEGHTVVYGGSTGGCMGALARGVQSKGGRLIGVIPEMDFMDGQVQPGLTEVHKVANLSARKEKMNDLADAFLVLPGGIGTLDEAFAVLALKSAGNYPKRIVFFNYMDAWRPLLEALQLLAEQRLVRHNIDQLLTVVDKPEQVRENLVYGL